MQPPRPQINRNNDQSCIESAAKGCVPGFAAIVARSRYSSCAAAFLACLGVGVEQEAVCMQGLKENYAI